MTGSRAESNEAEHNVWVAHLRDGIQAVGLHTGRTICKLHLASPGLHVDLNGDGLLDHLQAIGKHPLLVLMLIVLMLVLIGRRVCILHMADAYMQPLRPV